MPENSFWYFRTLNIDQNACESMSKTFEWTNEWPFRTVRDPVWCWEDQICVRVRIRDNVEESSYVCAPDDCVPHSRELFRRCVAGEFGPVAPYVPPTPEQIETELAKEVRRERDQRIAATDWTQFPDVPESTRALWQPYRQALRDVPQQDGFPHDVTWPDPPQ